MIIFIKGQNHNKYISILYHELNVHALPSYYGFYYIIIICISLALLNNILWIFLMKEINEFDFVRSYLVNESNILVTQISRLLPYWIKQA